MSNLGGRTQAGAADLRDAEPGHKTPGGRLAPGEGRSLWLGAACKATRGQQYTDQGQAYYEERYRERVVANLTRRAQQLGLQLVPLAGASPQTATA